MKKTNIKKLVETAVEYVEKGILWHHHLITPACALNDTEGDYQIILENEESGESFVCYFEKRPMEELKHLEDIFFRKG